MSGNVFIVKEDPPDDPKLRSALGESYGCLLDLRSFLKLEIGDTVEEWKYYGKKIGWTMKTFLKKRNLFFITVYPGEFMISFVYGDKAVDKVQQSNISTGLKMDLLNARKYAEGRGLSLRISNIDQLSEVQELIRIKVNN